MDGLDSKLDTIGSSSRANSDKRRLRLADAMPRARAGGHASWRVRTSAVRARAATQWCGHKRCRARLSSCWINRQCVVTARTLAPGGTWSEETLLIDPIETHTELFSVSVSNAGSAVAFWREYNEADTYWAGRAAYYDATTRTWDGPHTISGDGLDPSRTATAIGPGCSAMLVWLTSAEQGMYSLWTSRRVCRPA